MNNHLFYDEFVCNAIDDLYKCSPNNRDNTSVPQGCDDVHIKENCEYANRFGELQRQEKNFTNTNEVFKRTWLQIFNLTIANGLLVYFLYQTKIM